MNIGLMPPLLAGFAGTIALVFIIGWELPAYRRRDDGKSAQLIASGSNNLLKAGYAMVLSRQRAMLPAAAWPALTLALSIAYSSLVG